VLRSYGYDEARLRGVRCDSLEMMAPDGSTIFKTYTDFVHAAYGSPWYLCHRVDLHNELKHLAFSTEGAGPPAKLHLSSKVASVDPEKGEITLVSGQVFKGDLIIGADGIHSIVREHVLGGDFSPPPTGHSAFRFLLSASRLAADPVAAKYVPSADKPGMIIISDSEKRLVLYPCRDATILNAVAIHPDHLSQRSGTEEWNANTRTAEDLKRVYADFASEYHRLFELADEIKLWQLRDRPPLDTWIKGRACLLGDACHPMLPRLSPTNLEHVYPRLTPRRSGPGRRSGYRRWGRARRGIWARHTRCRCPHPAQVLRVRAQEPCRHHPGVLEVDGDRKEGNGRSEGGAGVYVCS
jgi:salicylate hydroxylase